MASHQNVQSLVDHLFRHEAGKMVAVLTRLLGTAPHETAVIKRKIKNCLPDIPHSD